jgi:flagellin
VDTTPNKVLSNFTVSSNRTLSLTDADGSFQRKDYVSGNQETLGFSDFGIQVDLASDYDPSNSLDGTDVEIAANRDLQVGADNDINHQLQLGISSVTANGLRISGSAVVDIDQARAAITSLDRATDMVNQERSYLGSMQNRLSFTMSNLASQTQNIEASRSSIQDADFASEAMNLSRSQILSQSSSAMLAQANALTQNILGLLR